QPDAIAQAVGYVIGRVMPVWDRLLDTVPLDLHPCDTQQRPDQRQRLVLWKRVQCDGTQPRQPTHPASPDQMEQDGLCLIIGVVAGRDTSGTHLLRDLSEKRVTRC